MTNLSKTLMEDEPYVHAVLNGIYHTPKFKSLECRIPLCIYILNNFPYL